MTPKQTQLIIQKIRSIEEGIDTMEKNIAEILGYEDLKTLQEKAKQMAQQHEVKLNNGAKVLMRCVQLEDGMFEGIFDLSNHMGAPEGVEVVIKTTYDMDGYCSAEDDFSIVEWYNEGKTH